MVPLCYNECLQQHFICNAIVGFVLVKINEPVTGGHNTLPLRFILMSITTTNYIMFILTKWNKTKNHDCLNGLKMSLIHDDCSETILIFVANASISEILAFYFVNLISF